MHARARAVTDRIKESILKDAAQLSRAYFIDNENENERMDAGWYTATDEHYWHHPHTSMVVRSKISAGTMRTRLRSRK